MTTRGNRGPAANRAPAQRGVGGEDASAASVGLAREEHREVCRTNEAQMVEEAERGADIGLREALEQPIDA